MPLLEDQRLLEEIATIIQDVLDCRVSASYAARLRAPAINQFFKEESTKIQPITPGSVWQNVAGHVALDAAAKGPPPLSDD